MHLTLDAYLLPPIVLLLMTTTVENNSIFRSFFEKQKLSGPNFIDWYRQLRLVLSTEDKENYLEHPIPAAPVALPGQQVPPEALAAHAAWVKGQKEVAVLIEFHACKQEEGQSVSSYMLKMKTYIDNLERLDQPISQNLAVSLILVSLSKDYDSFMQNYNMHDMGKTVNELHSMLKLHEYTLPKKYANPALHAIRVLALQGLWGSKKLKPGALSLYVGNGNCAAIEAIGSYDLELPSGLVIVLTNCHYAPSITRVYFVAVPRDGIFEIDMSCSNTNDSSIKKCIEKLQHEGLLNSTDIQSLGKCVSCMSGKMARKLYSHQVEMAKDLLGLIHTDVCGPFKIVSRQGASYFVTFTDDFSRYGYVYLLKHKHEVFETFKVFKKEVENQLGKTIKSLRFDRGGEYMSQEFLDHLKEHGIIAHRTPPYTPQNNGVFERRNRTLLDMVRYMMSQTTLPKSFWDYALETAARILNMVPTKKVDKTSYEV
ncbi:retrotransposon protein, putative, ty1-copia subclass [Tanacetum coccineum]|uniref:Retrotransposon protein, putative, ty1-copia subclass n=1 Tax=Tanacetum coccineum TaxID=301880 RepID=A0ABQ4Y459_9ASTR